MQTQEMGNIFVPLASDALLARVTLAGDQKAFAALIQRYGAPIFNFAYRFLGDYQLAGDILQEVCLRFYHALPTGPTRVSFKLWLLRMTYTCCIDELRCRLGRTYRLSQFYGPCGINDAVCVRHEAGEAALSADLQQIITRLLPKQRAVIILRSILRLSFEEIGQVVEMPASAARTCFMQAKMVVRQYLRERPPVGLEKM